ncbi:DNA-binding protein, virulence gene repressor RsaL [Actinobacillus lignieresii]|uniref:helix-turn-helix domain-containing protein n=1 Tax=Actinobacillus lignieresii TaxID=720 RepID=UPI000E13BCE7|nr:type II toxin-antitoxin system MqsA family antitoxin [Actinobacillus lignieresii]SUT99915.1 DNA-binding protein, virulence gene repressor RsaL [Actinobacillus lignieresii]VEB27182.1 DNA-binding protein, virulence gene repressor RsaL [Actinobacillus lignieresii]
MGRLFDDLMEGAEALEQYLQGKITLRTTVLEKPEPIELSPSEVKSIREKLNLSQAVFAHKLHTSVRTYQGWEQGKTKPNPQAVLLLRMVDKSPQLLEQMAQF